MALCSTGCMSMGGSDAPRSINCELGSPGSATICLNNPAVRTLAGVPAGAISLCDFYGKINSIYNVEYLVVAGGGGGGAGNGGGGGAGGVWCETYGILQPSLCVSIPIIVGAGGARNPGTPNTTGPTCPGTNSCFGCIRTTCGGGGGGRGIIFNPPPMIDATSTGDAGRCGGSGGGSGWGSSSGPSAACLASGGCSISQEGNCGGFSYRASPVSYTNGGGGGGKCTAGCYIGIGGQGGTWPHNQIFTIGVLCNGCYYIAGGGGGGQSGGPGQPQGGLGGGGCGGQAVGVGNATASCARTGSGGGAGGQYQGPLGTAGAGGGVWLRYPSNRANASVTGSPCFCCTGGFKYYYFQGSGTISFCC